MDFELSEEQRHLQATVRELRDRLQDAATEASR